MAPSRKNARKSRTLKKKKKLDHQDQKTNPLICCDNSSVLKKKKKMDNEISSSSVGCTTPKAQKYQIPEILTCPPAPKKRRIDVSSCTTLRRTPISFFEPPDIELFFASHLASIYNHVLHTHHVR